MLLLMPSPTIMVDLSMVILTAISPVIHGDDNGDEEFKSLSELSSETVILQAYFKYFLVSDGDCLGDDATCPR